MKKFLYSSGVLALIAGTFMGVSNANLDQCSTDSVIPLINNNDECYFEEVLLRDIDYPDNLREDILEVSVKNPGTGTVVLKPKKNSGFPRLILLGDTMVTSERYAPENSASIQLWDGKLFLPKNARPADKNKFVDNSTQVDRGTSNSSGDAEDESVYVKVNVLKTFQFGDIYDNFRFSQPTFISFLIDQPNGSQVWIAGTDTEAGEDELSSNTESKGDHDWSFIREDYCVVENNVCTFKIEADKVVNKLALVKPLYNSCPKIRIEHGRYTSAPECKIVCNEGYLLPFGERQCQPASEVDNSQEDLTDKDNYSNPWSRTRQGYFRFRDTRGSQLTQAAGADDLNEAETEYVNDKNAAINGRTNKNKKTDNNESSEIDDAGLWKKFQELVWTNDTTGQYHKSREEKAKKIEEDRIDNNANQAGEKDQSTRTISQGGLLPSTGSGAFVALAIAGLATMGFALRRRR